MQYLILIGVGNSGLGFSIAKKFGQQGFGIILMERNLDHLTQTVTALKQFNISVTSIQIDLANSDSIKAAFIEAQTFGEITGLIYNAVARRTELPSQLTRTHVEADLSLNIGAVVDSVQQLLPIFMRDNGGTMIFTGGGVADTPAIKNASMSLGKAALKNYVYALGKELKSEGVFVGLVTITKGIQPNTDYSPDIIADLYWQMYVARSTREVRI